jgi:hypothetical protein
VNSYTVSSNSRSGSNGSSSGSSNSDAEKFRSYARSLIYQSDRNRNGSLDRDEWDRLSSDQRGADSNRDGVITLDEMTTKLSSYSRGSSGSSRYGSSAGDSSAGRRPWWISAGDKNAAPKKSYRFLSPSERLPKGLPDWFLRNDADGDGQIIMTEYTSSWTEAAAADFIQKDLNGDGFITADECLSADKH